MMTFTLADLEKDFEEVVEIHESALAETKGSGHSIVPEGTALGLITGFIEMGNHTSPKTKKSTPRGMLELRLFDIDGEPQQYTRTIKDDDGNEETVGTPISHNFMNINSNDKAGFRKDMLKLLEACGIDDQDASPIRLIGKHIMVDGVHNKVDDKTYTNLDIQECKAPFDCDRKGKPDLSKPLALPVDPATVPIRAFVWKAPTPSYWASIEIEGTYEVEEDGKKVEKSKNWIQERIRSADNFSNSPVESMLMQAGNSSTPLPKATKAKKASQKPVEDVSKVEPTPTKEEASKTVSSPSEEVSEVSSALTDEEEAKLAQVEQMIKMCEESNMPADQFIAERDALIAKRDA